MAQENTESKLHSEICPEIKNENSIIFNLKNITGKFSNAKGI